MARIVMVHGAFNELWGPHEIAARWVPALRDGLWHHGTSVEPDEIDICFYGDLFRLDPETLDSDEWQRSRSGASDLLTAAAGEGGGDLAATLGQAASQEAWDRTVDMVALLVNDPSVARTARERLAGLIGPDTSVVVAHSLGTVLAYNVLVDQPDPGVDTLVTLGSPLGTKIAAAMMPAPGDDGLLPWPGSVRRWVNVAAIGDRATGSGELAPRFGPRVEDRRVDNGHRAHDPQPYLNAAATGEAVAAALARG